VVSHVLYDFLSTIARDQRAHWKTTTENRTRGLRKGIICFSALLAFRTTFCDQNAHSKMRADPTPEDP
jgi:hypothetical protein